MKSQNMLRAFEKILKTVDMDSDEIVNTGVAVINITMAANALTFDMVDSDGNVKAFILERI